MAHTLNINILRKQAGNSPVGYLDELEPFWPESPFSCFLHLLHLAKEGEKLHISIGTVNYFDIKISQCIM